MIERCMHFIWIGNHIPEYGLKNIDAFCKMNPSFACNVVHIPDVKHISDNRHAMIWDQIMNSYGQYLPTIEYYRMIGRHDNQVFSNVLRYDILNQNGGIYLDLDCVPCNPFDEQLLKHDFAVSRKYNSSCIRRDCYFLGKSSTTRNIISYMDPELVEIFDVNSSRMKLIEMRKKMKLGIVDDVSSEFYFVHANMEEWTKWW